MHLIQWGILIDWKPYKENYFIWKPLCQVTTFLVSTHTHFFSLCVYERSNLFFISPPPPHRFFLLFFSFFFLLLFTLNSGRNLCGNKSIRLLIFLAFSHFSALGVKWNLDSSSSLYIHVNSDQMLRRCCCCWAGQD